MRTGPNIRLRADGRYEARYEKARDGNNKIIYGYCYGRTYEEAAEKRRLQTGESGCAGDARVKRMNLLILGAGGQSCVVQEIAQSIGIFSKIGFLDDDPANPRAMAPCSECARFLEEYPIAIPSVGDNALRMQWIGMLIKTGFILPTLIAPTATVSPSAQIGYGTLIEPKATVGANCRIGNGCIISAGAVIERDVEIGNGLHIGCGVIIRKEPT